MSSLCSQVYLMILIHFLLSPGHYEIRSWKPIFWYVRAVLMWQNNTKRALSKLYPAVSLDLGTYDVVTASLWKASVFMESLQQKSWFCNNRVVYVCSQSRFHMDVWPWRIRSVAVQWVLYDVHLKEVSLRVTLNVRQQYTPWRNTSLIRYTHTHTTRGNLV